MNREAIQKTIDAIDDADPGQFHMATVWHMCGTPACICGFALEANGVTSRHATEWMEHITGRRFIQLGGEILGLSPWEQIALFTPKEFRADWRNVDVISRDEAINTLRHLLKTGNVDWEAANAVEEEIQ